MEEPEEQPDNVQEEYIELDSEETEEDSDAAKEEDSDSKKEEDASKDEELEEAKEEEEDPEKLEEREEKERILRSRYRGFISELQTKGADESYLRESFRMADSMIIQVSKPREALYDSKIVNMQANIVKKKAQSLNSNLIQFKPEQFAYKFQSFFSSVKFGAPKPRTHADKFTKFGKISSRILPTPPSLYPMYNTFEETNVQLPKKFRQARLKDEISTVVEKPKCIDPSGKDSSEQDATEAVERILNILHKLHKRNLGKPESVCYFSFVTNPDSFAETIENMFYVSILAKEGAVEIGVDADNLPFIEPIAPDQMHNVKLHGNYTQSIISLDRQDWQNIVNEFGITRAVITRPKKKDEA